MQRMIYIGEDPFLVGHTAVMRDDGCVQVDSTAHSWCVGWHRVDLEDWTELADFVENTRAVRAALAILDARISAAICGATSKDIADQLRLALVPGRPKPPQEPAGSSGED